MELVTSVENTDKFSLSKQLQRALLCRVSLISAAVEAASVIWRTMPTHRSLLIFWWCAVMSASCVLFRHLASSLSICSWDPPLNQNRHLWPDTMGGIVPPWKESMCFANAALAAANLRDNFYIQPLIKEHSYAWMTSSKVPGGCGKGPVSKCGLNRGAGPASLKELYRVQLSERGLTVDRMTKTVWLWWDTRVWAQTETFGASQGILRLCCRV